MTFWKRNFAKIVLGIILCFGLAFYFISFDGYYFYDDLKYMRYAFQCVNLQFGLTTDTFCHRVGLIYPVALIYKIFGVSDWSSTFFNWICWAGSVLLCYQHLKKYQFGASIGVVLCALDYYHLFLCNKVYPDVPVTLFVMLSLLYLHKMVVDREMTFVNAGFFILFVLIALLTKTTVIYILPFLMVIFAQQLSLKQHRLYWLKVCFAGFFTLLVFFFVYDVIAGDPFYLLNTIEKNQYTLTGTYSKLDPWRLIARLTYEPILMFINCGMIVPFVLSLASFKQVFNKSYWNINDSERFWLAAVLSILGMFWFSSMSFKFYEPMTLNPRMVLLVVPPLAVLAALNLRVLFVNRQYQRIMILLFGLISVLCFLFISHTKSIVYILLAMVFVSQYFIQKQSLKKGILVFGIFISLVVQPVYSMFKPKIYHYKEEKHVFQQCLVPYVNQKILVISDDRLVHNWSYYFKFSPPKKWKFVRYDGANGLKLSDYQSVFVLVNKGFSAYLQQTFQGDMNQFTLVCGQGNKVLLYKLNQ
jgi:hypothetical protein